jgi:hypothetical protein
MRTAAIPLAVAFGVVCHIDFAQSASQPAGSCRAMEDAARGECLNNPLGHLAQLERPASHDSNWLVSETTSPVDYSPIVIATTSSRGTSDNSSMQLSVYCRSGRTELVVAGPTILRGAQAYALTYRVNNDPPVPAAAVAPSFGPGAAFKDGTRLLQLLPEDGEFVVRVSPRTGAAQEGRFSLHGWTSVRDKLAMACKWPRAIARPHT